MNDEIQLVDIAQMGDDFDIELMKDEIAKKFEKIKKSYENSKMKVYFKKHHESEGGNAKCEVRVSVETPQKTFISDKIDFSVMDAVSEAMDSAEKETRKYFEKKKQEMINESRLGV